jgi:hypothetical protein
MSAEHTPGPWVVYDDSNNGKTNRIEIAALGKTVARIYHSVPEEDLPNARLIAAAPDLLEAAKLALQSAESWIHDQLDGTSSLESALAELEPVRAAIAQATGGQE